MKSNHRRAARLFRPWDGYLPAAFLLTALLDRDDVALGLFVAFYCVKVCALSSSNGLRAAFAGQPSARYAQGSALIALLLQFAGALTAAPLYGLIFPGNTSFALIACGLLLNIEHVFCEYLYAMGEYGSAGACRAITALMALTGMLLCAPRGRGAPEPISAPMLIVPIGIAALVSLVIGLSLCGRLRPRLNAEVLRRAPLSLLHTALYPLLALAASHFLALRSSAPLFCGLLLYELCKTPFRRAPAESMPMNRALLIACAAASLCTVAICFSPLGQLPANISNGVLHSCAAILLAALCAFCLFGNLDLRKSDARSHG